MSAGMSVEDRFAIQDVMSNYARGVDERNQALYRSCFADDVEIVGFGDGVVTGGDAWAESVWQQLERFGNTQHLLGPVACQVDGDTASARTDVQALHFMADDPEKTLILWATYFSDFKKINGEWRISRHELVRRGVKID